MPKVVFTENLKRYIACAPQVVAGRTVSESLGQVFREYPMLRGYVLDDQGSLRRHVVVFVNDQMVKDRARLSDPVSEGQEIFVMQALSGG